MKLRVAEWDGKFHDALIIKHDFDTDWLLMVLVDLEHETLKKTTELRYQALEYSKDTMTGGKSADQTNRYSFGKLHVKVKGLYFVPNVGKLFFRLRMGPF
jgi:hypothetical protein